MPSAAKNSPQLRDSSSQPRSVNPSSADWSTYLSIGRLNQYPPSSSTAKAAYMIVGFITMKRSSRNQIVSYPKQMTRKHHIRSIREILPRSHELLLTSTQ